MSCLVRQKIRLNFLVAINTHSSHPQYIPIVEKDSLGRNWDFFGVEGKMRCEREVRSLTV